MNVPFSWQLFHQLPIIGILRHMPQQQTFRLAEYYFQAGLTTLEVTMNSEGVTDTIAELTQAYAQKLNIGAGTVCTLHDLDQAMQAGASFIVSPILNEDLIRRCVAEDIPVFPGAYTPTEIYRAWSLGASMVKVFPATQLGPAYVKDVLAPLPQLKLLPTGGVTADNFADFLRAGAHGVGMGSSLFPRHIVEQGDWEGLKIHLAQLLDRYQQHLHNPKGKHNPL